MDDWRISPRCFSDQAKLVPGDLSLTREEARHLLRVRRVGQGDRVCVLNGRGFLGQGTLHITGRDEGGVELEEVSELPRIRPEIVLCVGALKQSAWDELLKHSVELGVNRIFRVQTERSVSELKSEKQVRKLQRWRECMIEACKQSANPWLPELRLLGNVKEALDEVPEGVFQVLAGLEGDPPSFSEVLPEVFPSSVVLWVGPEGDFTSSEMTQIVEAGAHSVNLGERILRAETAALALLARCRLQ